MNELISKENILIDSQTTTWNEAITRAGELLVNSNTILLEHMSAMIEAVEKFGPYIVLIPNVAIAHAAPSPFVLQNGLSLAIFENDIHFGCINDPVRLIFGLAAVDNHSHIDLLRDLSDLLQEKGVIENLIQCRNIHQAYLYCNNLTEKEIS